MAHRVLFYIYNDTMLMDLAGPADVFATANRFLELASRPKYYETQIRSLSDGPIRCSNGIHLHLADELSPSQTAQDTLIIVGGRGARVHGLEASYKADLAQQMASSQRIASICTGAFAMAAAGLPPACAITTHFAYCEELSKLYPDLKVEQQQVYVNDGKFWSSAGVSSGIDLCLKLVELDLGAEIAQQVAEYLVMYTRRDGRSPQRSALLRAQGKTNGPIAKVVEQLLSNPAKQWTIPQLAKSVAMSERNFRRVFRTEYGESPQHFMEKLRLNLASELLLSGERNLKEIAQELGFGSSDSLRRSFQKEFGCPPSEYRRQSVPH